MQSWGDDIPAPAHQPTGVMGAIRAARRGVPLAFVTFGCLALLLLVRLLERPLGGMTRPVTPKITRFVCWSAFRILGMRHVVEGTPMQAPGAMVANHSSWLDIFVLNAPAEIYFVSKSEVANWPGIGWLARATGTIFIERKRERAADQKKVFEDRLKAGHKLLFFPEGTSTDGRRVLPFKSTLFAAFFSPDLREVVSVQPVSVIYEAPDGEDRRFYGWWGEMSFGGHLYKTLSAKRNGSVRVIYHDPIPLDQVDGRKDLAQLAQSKVSDGLAPILTDEARQVG